MTFGAAVKAAREALGWTQGALGGRVGVSGVQISRIESGERLPSFEVGTLIAKELDTDLRSFVGLLRADASNISSEEEIATGAA